jgi:hypothetical protein
MGQVYYDMGLLSSTEVVECSVTDLVGEYCGQVSIPGSVRYAAATKRNMTDWTQNA